MYTSTSLKGFIFPLMLSGNPRSN